MIIPHLLLSIFAVVAAAVVSAAVTWAIRPWLLRHALAKPNARSSHRIPTPQGAGIAVIGATVVVAGAIVAYADKLNSNVLLAVFAASLFMAVVGFADDVKSIPVLPRLILQAVAVGTILFTVPSDIRIVPAAPLWIERGLLLLAGLWFVNLVNFMDGLDWMTVAEVVPITATMVVLGWFGEFPPSAAIVAAALCGAMAGFAPLNRPVAKVFLGDVGSLPIGLVLGWCLLQLAYNQQIVAAMLLPLYYLADATVTLLRRLTRGEPVWAAHRSHFYQRATDNGFSVTQIIGRVFALNVALIALAAATLLTASFVFHAAALIAGCVLVAVLLYHFAAARA
jgi:UDP-N-acetylmuramyl pentapeptide phosphotransferase/UDP-N-acetylglucosamine-1-phosphate transferase